MCPNSYIENRDSIGTKLGPVDLSIVYRLFNPQVPVVVCSKFRNEVAAMPANSCASASDSPPMITLAIKKGLKTERILHSSAKFSINWLNFEPKETRDTILHLSKPGKEGKVFPDKLKAHHIPYSLQWGIPVLNHACAYALCDVLRRVSTGGHFLFIAKVVLAKAWEDFTKEGYWGFQKYQPILYMGSIRADPLITLKGN